MSVTLFDNALWLDLPPIPKFVLAILCERARLESGICWPSVKYIAARASMSERRVQDHLKSLEAMGYMSRVREKHGPGKTIRRKVAVKRILDEGRAAQDAFRAKEEEPETPDDSSGEEREEREDRPVNIGRSRREHRTVASGEHRTVASDDPLSEPIKEPTNGSVSARARAVDVGELIKQGIAARITGLNYDTWVRDAEFLIESESLVVYAASEQARQWIEGRLAKTVGDVAAAWRLEDVIVRGPPAAVGAT